MSRALFIGGSLDGKFMDVYPTENRFLVPVQDGEEMYERIRVGLFGFIFQVFALSQMRIDDRDLRLRELMLSYVAREVMVR